MLDEFHENSRIAIVDTSDPNREWMTPAQAREMLRGLATRAGSQSVTTAVSIAYDLMVTPDPGTNEGDTEDLPRFLYVLGDRTVASWDVSRTADLIARREKLPPPEIVAYFIDVGVEKPIDVAITSVDLKPQSVPTNQPVVIKATVTATGQACDVELQCKILGDNTVERKPVKLEAGQSDVIRFEKKDLKPGQYQAELTLFPKDSLDVNNSRFVTFEVRVAQKIGIITDDEEYTGFIDAAIQAQGDFACEVFVNTPDKIPTADELKQFRAIFLLSVAHPSKLWEPLEAYVNGGGHLLVVPGREEMIVKEYNDPPAAKRLLPGTFGKDIAIPGEKGAKWLFGNFKHSMLKRFGEWDQAGVSFMRVPRSTYHYWSVTPAKKENVIVSYDLKDSPPALLEQAVNRPKDAGRVLLFTTAFDYRTQQKEKWNNFADTTDAAFLVSLINEAIRYCAGDPSDIAFNFTSGQSLALALPMDARFSEYQIDGPGLTGSDTKLGRGDTETDLRIRQTGFAGNYTVTAVGAPWKTSFSLNPATNEFQLEPVPVEEIEKLFGAESVVAAESNKKIASAIGGNARRSRDLFGTLLVLFVLAFCFECFLANRFYKPEEKPQSA